MKFLLGLIIGALFGLAVHYEMQCRSLGADGVNGIVPVTCQYEVAGTTRYIPLKQLEERVITDRILLDCLRANPYRPPVCDPRYIPPKIESSSG